MKQKALLLLLFCLFAGVKVGAVEINGVYYILSSDNQATITHDDKYSSSYSGFVTIPMTITYNGRTYRVTCIGDKAFYECKDLASVSIPTSVRAIAGQAFQGCSGLTSITIPTSVETIGYAAFSSCSGLNSVNIPSSVTSIAEAAFSGCTSMQYVNIPYGVTSIGRGAFYGCSSLTSVTIPSSLTSIDKSVFSGCSSLTSVDIPKSVTSIGDAAFRGCSSLTFVDIPSSVNVIGSFAFADCGLTAVNISYGVKYIANQAFAYCKNLTSVIIPESVTSTGQLIFLWCENLTSATIPNSLTSTGNGMFSCCRGLTSVTIGKGLTSIDGMFSGCSSLTSITIPENITSIDKYAFSDCSALANVIIGKGVTNIGSRAFHKCTGLKEIYCYAEEIPEVSSDAFTLAYGYLDRSYIILVVPDDAVEKYKAHSEWGKFGFIVPIGKYENTENVEIASAEDLANFAARVNAGEISLCATLKADIDFTAYSDVMIGNGISYRGDFDGAGHIIKLAQNRTSINAGLFCNLSGHVHDLTITGTITTSAKFAGGIAAQTENATIERCQSLVSINSSVNGDGTHGGIVGVSHAGTIVRDCLISGSITGSQTTCCAGVSGWADGPTTISNCLIKSSFTVGISGSDKLARNNSKVISSNNYFQGTWDAANDCGNVTLLAVNQVKSGEACFLLNNGRTNDDMAWYQTLGKDDCPVPDSRHKQVFYDEERGYYNMVGAKGDLNGDGKVDIADAVSVLNVMAESTNEQTCDVNGDGRVDIADFVTILNIMAQQ